MNPIDSHSPGYEGRGRLAAPVRLLAFCLVVVGFAGLALQLADPAEPRFAGRAPQGGASEAVQTPERHLILVPGGGFTRFDPLFEKVLIPATVDAGFVPHLLRYRLNDFGGAVDDARELANDLSGEHGRENVFAFGSSAGGTLAAILAGEGRVAAAVASSALYDFSHWPWVNLYWGQEYFEEIKLGPHGRRHLSPMRRPLRCPLLVAHGTQDPVVSVFQAEDYVYDHPRATMRLYFGGHGIYRQRPASITASMRWLHRVGRIHARESEHGGGSRGVRTLRENPRADLRLRRFRQKHSGSLCAEPRPLAGMRLGARVR